MSHITELEEIDRLQREQENEQKEKPQAEVFAKPMVEALDPHSNHPSAPLLEQEEIEDQEPPRINLTAVVCTAIVAVCATIILLVSQPWKNSDADKLAATTPVAGQQEQPAANPDSHPDAVAKQPKAEPATKAAEQPKAEQPKAEQPKAQAAPKEVVDPKVSTLPILKTKKTGTDNPYNSIRLIDASSRLLTKSEVEQMSLAELALARNAIYARHGYQYNNAELREYFAKQSWFKPSDVKIDEIPFTSIELANIKLIKSQEQKK